MEPARRLWLRRSGRLLGAVGLVGVFLGSAGAGVVLHADLPIARRLVASLVSRGLSDLLEGTVEVAPLAHVSPRRLLVPRATLSDAYGHRVLTLADVRIDLSLRLLAHDLLFGRDRLTIIVDHVRVERAEVELLADPRTGEPTIARAIAPKPTGAPSTGAGAAADTGARVFLPTVEIGLVVAHGRFKDQPPLEAQVRRVQGQLLATPHGVAVDVNRFGAKIAGFGNEARGTGTLSVRAPGPARGTFEGFFGDVEVKTSAFIDGRHVEIVADVPGASPRAVSAVLPGWPLRETVSGHIALRGDYPELRAEAALRVGRATLDAEGPVHFGPSPSAELSVRSRHLDARAVLEEAPATDLAVDAQVKGHLEDGRLVTDAHGSVAATVIAGQNVPELELDAHVGKDGASGSADVREPGLPLRASFHVTADGAVDVDATSTDVDLAHVSRFGARELRGRGRARLRAHVEGKTVRGTVTTDLSGVAAGGVTLKTARVEADVRAPLDSLADVRGSVHVSGTKVVAAGFALDQMDVTARGDTKALDFQADAKTPTGLGGHAEGKLELGARTLVRGTELSLRHGPILASGHVDLFDPERGELDVPRFRVAGAGGPVEGALRLRKDLIEVEAHGENVDLDALATAFDLPRGTIGGKLRVSAELTSGRDVTRGRIRLGLGNATIGTVGGVSLSASVDLEDERLSGEASGLVAGLGTFGATWDTELAGPAFVPSSFRDLTGRGEIQLSDWMLPILGALLPQDFPVRRLDGRAYARVLFERKTKEAPLPNVFATLATRDLAFDWAREGGAPLHVSGTDVSMTGALDGASGDSTGTALVTDPKGDLLTATYAVRLDPAEFRAKPASAAEKLLSTPIDLVVTFPSRPVANLPELVRPTGLSGSVGGALTLRGTLLRPTLFASVNGVDLTAEDGPALHPANIHAEAQYEWNTHEVSARASASLAGRTVGTALFRGVLPDGDVQKWTGEGRVDLDGLPIDIVPALADAGAEGELTGRSSFSRDAGNRRIAADLRLVRPTVARTSLGEGSLEISTDGNQIVARVKLVGDPGRLDAEGNAAWQWDGLLPGASAEGPAHLHVVTHDFGAVAFSPLLRGVISRVGGRVDADITVAATPERSPEGETRWSSGAHGKVALRQGSVLIDVLGLEVRDLSFHAEAEGEGRTTRLAVRDMRGRVRSSEDNLEGSADLVLLGFALDSGTGSLETRDLPILFHGAPQGRATGRATARLHRESDHMQVDVDVPSVTLRLPQSSARNVIDLTENADIAVVQLQKEVEEEAAAFPWRLAVHLGSDVNIRRSDVDLGVTGTPILDLAKETTVSGSVDLLPGGRIPVLGKVFVVEHGRVIFDTGELANPRVDVTAAWRSPTDAVVYVEVTGTLREAHVRLRSDPPLPEPEVFALLLGGSSSAEPSPAEQVGTGGGAAGAVALGSGVGVLGVNELLSDSPVELRVETTAESRPRYTAAVRVRPNLWFEASTYQQSEHSSQGPSDRNVVSGTVDYRFTRRWSLRTEVGTSGGALDLLWQYRY